MNGLIWLRTEQAIESLPSSTRITTPTITPMYNMCILSPKMWTIVSKSGLKKLRTVRAIDPWPSWPWSSPHHHPCVQHVHPQSQDVGQSGHDWAQMIQDSKGNCDMAILTLINTPTITPMYNMCILCPKMCTKVAMSGLIWFRILRAIVLWPSWPWSSPPWTTSAYSAPRHGPKWPRVGSKDSGW